jgi:hypothetical protein
MTLFFPIGRTSAVGDARCRLPRRRELPSVLLFVAAWLSILPIVAVTTTNNKENSWSIIPNVSQINKKHLQKRRWVTFLRGGGHSSNEEAVAEDVIDPTTSSASSSSFATTEYRTVQIQIVHRHGDRSPITPLKDESYWESTLVPPDMLKQVARGTNVLHHAASGTDGGTIKHVAHGRGPFGKLTKMGLLQMIEVGSRLKEELERSTKWSSKAAFVNNHNDGGPITISPHDMKIFSTDFDRTIQSVQGVLVGFFPDGPSEIIDIDCRHTTSWMIPDPQPRRTVEQEALEVELASRPHMLEREAEMRPLAIRCTQLLSDDAFTLSYGVGEEKNDQDSTATTRILSWAQLSEITKCLQVRNLLPNSISKEDQELTSTYCAWKWFESLRNPRLAYLSMHHFTHTIVHAMKDHDNQTPLIIFSCHDSSLIGLLCAFHLEQPSVWPEYGSVLKVELLEKIEHSPTENHDHVELVVRFSLNGEHLRSMWHGRLRDEIPLKNLSQYITTVGAVKA